MEEFESSTYLSSFRPFPFGLLYTSNVYPAPFHFVRNFIGESVQHPQVMDIILTLTASTNILRREMDIFLFTPTYAMCKFHVKILNRMLGEV